MKISDETYRLFGNEIIKQAAGDYQNYIIQDNRSGIKECERFFRSKWFQLITDVDGGYLMERLRNTTMEFLAQAKSAFDSGLVSKHIGDYKYEFGSEAFYCPVCGGEVHVDYKPIQSIFEPIGNGHRKKVGHFEGYLAHCNGCRIECTRKVKPIYYDGSDPSTIILTYTEGEAQ